MKTINKVKKVAAIAAMTFLMTSAATAAYSVDDETRNFSIMVEEPISLCADHEFQYPTGNPATWMVDPEVTLTDINNILNTSTSTLTVETYKTVEMTVDLNFQNGSDCNPSDGTVSALFPGGTVSATWSVPDFTMQLESCPALTPCSASTTNSVMAQMTSPTTAGIYSGSVLVSWVP